MTELISGSSSIENLITNIGWYKGSPVRIQQAVYDFLDEVLQNTVSLVDPTNPFILGLETNSVVCAMAVNESLLNQRRSYSALAQTDQDIYRHMTNDEYIGRFATPGGVNFQFMFDLNSLINAMVEDPIENCLKAIIPRDSYIVVDNYTFTLQYPIVFRKYNNGVLQITYDTTYVSPISTPSNNIISFKGRQDSTGVKWLYFTIPIKQMAIKSANFSVTKSKVFSENIAFTDEFVYARVFNKVGNNTSPWVEITSTHSDQNFDPDIPTAVLTATTGNLNITIPYIYNTNGSITGQIRVDLYTTKGDVTVNMSSYTLNSFSLTYRAIDTLRDNNAYSGVWGSITSLAFSDQILTGGKDGISFNELKEKITNYAFGSVDIPITPSQLETLGEENGFTIVKNADALTNRYILGIRPIPEISVIDTKTNAQKLLSRANVGMIRFSSTLEDLQDSDNVVNFSDTRTTLLSNTVFSLVNGVSSIVESDTVTAIKSNPNINELVSMVNGASYVYTPYYYVFDLQNELLDVRPYDLDHPDAANLNFIRQNTTAKLFVNVNTFAISKIAEGYRVTVIVASAGVDYKHLSDNQVGIQIRLTNKDGSLSGTINGEIVGLDDASGERIFQFDIETSYNVDENHCIEIINAYNTEGQVVNNFMVPLDSTIDILHWTNSAPLSFVSDETDTLINKTQLDAGSVGITHETLEVFVGQYLEHLWTRVRSYATGNIYKTSTVDVPAYYDTDVYEVNPVTGSQLFIDGSGQPYYTKIQNQGDLVLDILTGTTAPIGSIGTVGEYYLNTTTSNLYGPKTTSGWPGATKHVVQGWGAPAGSVGVAGDWYINKTTGDLYGPKSGGGWPGTISITIPPVYKYHEGDTILDDQDQPIAISSISAGNDFDILVIDGNLEFVTDTNYVSYREQIVTTISGWITNDILEVQNRVIEGTTIFFYPESSLGSTKILIDNTNSVYIDSEQSLSINVIVDETIINDPVVQKTMRLTINRYLDTNIRQLQFTINSFEIDLKNILGTNVHGVSISGLGGSANYESMNVSDEHNRLCIKRKLVAQTDNSTIVDYDTSIVFKTY